MKEQLLLISGAGMSFSFDNNLLRKNQLSKIFEIAEVGAIAAENPNYDFGYEKLNIEKIKEVVSNSKDLKYLNVIINMHGLVDEKDGYVLSRQEIDLKDDYYETINIPAKELMKELVEHTAGIPLKILASSCYGANFQDYLELLPNGSKIFTLSDRDTITFSADVSNDNIKGVFPKTLEELFVLTTLCQKVTNNTPMVGIKDNDTCIVKKLTELGMEYLASGQESHSEIFKAISENNPKVKQAITTLMEKVQQDHNTDSGRFNSKNAWEAYLDYCEGKISADAVKSLIAETNPLADISSIGVIPPFHKLYSKFKTFIENKMKKVGLESFIDQVDTDEFIDKQDELRKNKQYEKLKLLCSYNMLNEAHNHEELLHETKSTLDRLMAIKYGYHLLAKSSDFTLETQYIDPNDDNNLQLALYLNKNHIATISLDKNYHQVVQSNDSSVIIDMDAKKEVISSKIYSNKGLINSPEIDISLEWVILAEYNAPPSMHTTLCVIGADSLLV